MNRRYASAVLAVLALGFVVASPAHAGGASSGAAGVKKNANLTIKNTTADPYYMVVVPQGFTTPTTVGAAKKLGAILINPGKSIVYPVPAGSGAIALCDPTTVNVKDPNSAVTAVGGGPYTVGKGKMAYYKIIAGPPPAVVSGK